MRASLRTATLVLATASAAGCGSPRTSDGGQAISLSAALSPIATTSIRSLEWVATLGSADVVVEYAHGKNELVRVVRVSGKTQLALDGAGQVLIERPGRNLTALHRVGAPFSRLYGVVAAVNRPNNAQGVELHLLAEDRTTQLVSCFQMPQWSLGAVDEAGFWFAVEPASVCGIACPGAAALLRFDVDGVEKGTPTCIPVVFSSGVLLHPTQTYGLSGTRKVFSFGDGGYEWVYDDTSADAPKKALFYPLHDLRVHRTHRDGGADDLKSVGGGMVTVSPLLPASPFALVAINSKDGLTFDAVQPSGPTNQDYSLVSGSVDGGVTTRPLHMDIQTSSVIKLEYHGDHPTWLVMNEPDDAGVRRLLGQHLR